MTTPRERERSVDSRVWRALANAGRRGTSLDMLVERTHLDTQPVKDALRRLQKRGHCQFNGCRRWGVWVITELVPPLEERPAWLDEPPPAADRDDASHLRKRELATPVSSVFELGHALQQARVVAATTGASAPPVPDAPTASPAARPPAAAAGAPATAATAAAHAAGTPGGAVRAPVFSLDSQGTFVIELGEAAADVIALPPRVTRAMLRWLGQLTGLDLRHLADAPQQ